MKKLAVKRRTLALATGAAVVVVTGSVGTWWLLKPSEAAASPTTYTVAATTIQQTVSASGTVQPAQSADLSFAVSGTVTHVYVTPGQKVAVGTPLAAVDDSALVSQRTAASASLTAAQEQLSADSSGGGSEIQLANDRSSIAAAEASYATANDAVNQAVLRSTMAGTVDSVNLAVGDVTGGGSGGGSGASSTSSSSKSSAAVSIVSSQAYVVSATVAASDIATIKAGMQAQVTVSGKSDTVFGTVSTVGLVAQTDASGAAVFPVTISVTGTPTGLYPGTSATADIVVKQLANAIAVPTRAVQSSGSQTYVMRVVDGKVVKTDVVLGQVAGPLTQVTSGIKDGDVIQIPGFTRTGGTGGGGGNRGGFGGGNGFPGGGVGLPGGGIELSGGGQGTVRGPNG